jgi:hypothetical protein
MYSFSSSPINVFLFLVCQTEARTFFKTLTWGSFSTNELYENKCFNILLFLHVCGDSRLLIHPPPPSFPVGIQFVDCLNFSSIKKRVDERSKFLSAIFSFIFLFLSSFFCLLYYLKFPISFPQLLN